ncbi:hypothetical protein ACFQAV_06450 [Companilactobacillus huachuanensis]|uniref:Right-handed parallel beta-helix repeat-containing protein n=1 Tax=Companilactobacillus huachuanensis TaxID=2559914 RepID=A0ABW1RN37_9LACO|nr:hypothetical protein [Companilactobacillus huachuanensis]
MKTINVQSDREFFNAINTADNCDTIVLKSGEYFSSETMFLSIKKSLTIKGQYANAKATKINCGLFFGENTTVILENLLLTYDNEKGNTLALYDGAKLYCNNVIVNRTNESSWDTIYSSNSFISLKNSDIQADRQRNISSLSLENSQLMSVKSNIHLPLLVNSTAYLKDSFISYSIVLKKNSNLSFINLAIDSTQNNESSDFYVEGESTVNGDNLDFSKNEPFIDVLNSNFEGNDFFAGLDKVRWRYDTNSNVIIDGTEPFNNNL